VLSKVNADKAFMATNVVLPTEVTAIKQREEDILHKLDAQVRCAAAVPQRSALLLTLSTRIRTALLLTHVPFLSPAPSHHPHTRPYTRPYTCPYTLVPTPSPAHTRPYVHAHTHTPIRTRPYPQVQFIDVFKDVLTERVKAIADDKVTILQRYDDMGTELGVQTCRP
jgi:hypothetical protein